MFGLFESNSKLGIDIGTATIKVVELEKKDNRFNLLNYGLFELKGSTSTTGVAGQNILKLPDDEIIWGLKEVLSKAGIKSRNVIASIPSFSTFSTIIRMPYLSENELARAIPMEAKKYVPIPLDEVSMDWSIVEATQNKNDPGKPMVDIFIAAVPKGETDRYQKIMHGAGLNLKAIELENSALIRGLVGNDLSPVAIINIGGRSTSILIVSKGYERIGHNYEVGGFEITKSIARSLNVSPEKAEELKKKMGLSQNDGNIIQQAMASLIDMMVFETNKTIANYEESSGQKVAKVMLVGGMVNMPNFLNYFKQKLGREIFPGNPMARVVFPQGLNPAMGEIASTFAVATGLAMREV
jgi:type IV pilus assembly protein PilM